jgi:hypothetical protein
MGCHNSLRVAGFHAPSNLTPVVLQGLTALHRRSLGPMTNQTAKNELHAGQDARRHCCGYPDLNPKGSIDALCRKCSFKPYAEREHTSSPDHVEISLTCSCNSPLIEHGSILFASTGLPRTGVETMRREVLRQILRLGYQALSLLRVCVYSFEKGK